MRDVIICTVGTSMLGSLNRHDSSIILERNPLKTSKRMQKELEPSQQASGAEINSITSIVKNGLIEDKYALYLLISDTEDGSFFGNVLKNYYQDQFYKVEIKKLDGLHDQDFKDFRNKGLRNLVKTISEIIRYERNKGHNPIINATGGFKAQISFAGLIGQVLDVPVYYMFERFAEVIEMPPMPVSFDFSLWLENFNVLNEISSETIISKSDPIINKLDPKLSVLLHYENEDVSLSAMGELFHELFLQRFSRGEGPKPPKSSGIKPEDKKINDEHGHVSNVRGLHDYIRKICDINYVTRIQTLEHNLDLTTKKRFSKSLRGNDQLEGSYSIDGETVKFIVFITEDSALAVQYAVVDMTNKFCKS